ncbi:hypothetical protein G7K_0854-t1 [Saitoella complicata NRRL Y-17804]|uniref:Tc1-like transposase DDE domain-containing protein n=1 Tax=Saitoella complicata (strain BCRC 22490 / CBS 7301 / JCM 7358 / NBRC 10748 / NRRL Y-17804) TaxID=698492 RepID=A0A0E9N9R1_SAICN|nr:hypothetical protein G7K_0854-t1 [Saitoella complicata NRRL Y-17804]
MSSAMSVSASIDSVTCAHGHGRETLYVSVARCTWSTSKLGHRSAHTELPVRVLLSGQPVSDIAEWTGKHKSPVYRIKNQLGRPGKIDNDIGMHIQILYSNTPTLYHNEAADYINELIATDLNWLDVFRYLRKIGWTWKRLSVRAAQRNSTLQSHHSIHFADYTMDQLVFLDETAVDNRSAFRRFGYAPHSSPACEDRGIQRGLRLSSLLPAFSQEGMICHSVYQGSFDAHRFVDFMADKLLNVLKPFPAKHSVVVMDNCGTHHDPRVRELIIDHGFRIEYLPPYSPDLNP